ncbi:globin domain-containing protein [Algirhabdus cladophorae]|uniref:globin domain-containing protein n=1 Tax=Algirhabdus cladophorae TaxID=3377108 RepID=UPI003B846FE6
MLDLTDTEKDCIRVSWSKVISAPQTGADLFYGRLFEESPETRKLFKSDMASQGLKLMQTINAVVDNLDEDLSETVLQLGTRHQGYDVMEEDYAKVGAALIWMLDAMAGSDFDQSTQDAWGKAYGQICTVMLRGYA